MVLHALRVLILTAVALGAAATSHGQSITTAAPNNGSGGVFIDLTPTGGALNLNTFATYFSSAAGTPVNVEVWTRPGSYVGFTTSNAGWTLSQTVTGTSAGTATLSSPVALTPPILLPAGTTTAVYLHAVTTGGGIRYTGTGTTSVSTWNNADITLFSNVARTGIVAFAGTQNTPRCFAGTLEYSTANANATGACCTATAQCTFGSPAACVTAGGFFSGDGTSCTPNVCPHRGACCSSATNACTFSSNGAAGCAAGTTYQGDATTCSPNVCPQGACCNATTGACTLTAPTGCTVGTFQTVGSTCTVNPCPQEACCNTTTGACAVAATGACASGTTGQGTGTSCTVNPCPQPPPPANDVCSNVVTANAPRIPAAGGTVMGNNSAATDDGAALCTAGHKDVYFLFTPATTSSWVFATCNTLPSFDTMISIHTGCPADTSTQVVGGCNDDSCGLLSSVTVGGLIAGTQYIVRVGNFSAAGTGGVFQLDVNPVLVGACCNAATGICTTSNTGAAGCASGTTYQGDNSACTPNPCPQPPPPANDECSAAIAVSLGVQATGSNVNATSSGAGVVATNTGSCTAISLATGIHLDVWYRFVAPATTNYVIDTCGSTMPDTILSIHSACPADFSNILDCNDDSNAPAGNTACTSSVLNSRIQSVALTAGSTYYIGVAGYNGVSGAFNLLINYVSAAAVGSCCVSTTCTLADATTCTGTFVAGGSCTPSPCAPAGVCCRGATCTTSITTAAACTASLVPGQTAGSSFPSSASCNAAVISNAPCCYADYNKVGGITVTDIFNFLTDWFAGSPYARVGSNGGPGPLAVQNIFDFLTNWFAGGC